MKGLRLRFWLRVSDVLYAVDRVAKAARGITSRAYLHALARTGPAVEVRRGQGWLIVDDKDSHSQ